MSSPRPLRPLFVLVILVLCAAPFAALRWFVIELPEIESRPLETPRGGDGPRFLKLPSEQSGLAFRNELRPENRFTYLTNGAGMAVADYDKDGLPDLYLVSQDGKNRLFRQTSPLRFVDVTEAAGNVDGGEAWGSGATFADVDGDGWLDLYVCNIEAKNCLYRNRGDGTFEECAARFGLDLAAASTMAAFCDYDQDGDLDVFVVTNRALHAGWALVPEVINGMRPPAATVRTPAQMVPTLVDTANEDFQRLQRGESAPGLSMPMVLVEHFFAFHGRVYMAGQRDRLLRNDGNRFVDATSTAGIADHGMGLSATWCDYDQDGKPDLYVANDLESPDQLWHNEGSGRFRDVTKDVLPHTAYYGMGSDTGDVDGDGRPDFFVGDMSATTHRMAKILMGDMNAQRDFLIHGEPQQYMRNALLLNTGTSRFQEAAFLAGVASTDWTWSTLFGDLDNDARLDLFCTNGIARFDMDPDLERKKQLLWQAGRQQEAIDLIRTVQGVAEKNLALRNVGDLKFEKTGASFGLDVASISHGAVLCDFDRDGDLDVATNDFDQDAGLFENRTTDGNAVAFVLSSRSANTHGIGARIDIVSETGAQMRELWLARGYLSGQESRVCFGLGAATDVQQAIVRWPSGSVQVFEDLAAGREYTIREPRVAAAATIAIESSPAPVFSERADGPHFVSRERPFDDFAAQFLLPHQLSKLGPGLALGDADGDGDDDLFVGGAAGEAGALLRNDGGRFVAVDGPWQQDAECEDMGILWLDHDGDGDQDLLVCSGGVEAPIGSPLYRDRLYRNDGALTFVRDERALPDVRDSSSSACAADCDGDGDLDLVVGGRLVPLAFPDAPSSRYYRNDGGRFVDATREFAPALLDAGMVTSVVL
ncbi:MAG: CRTAC1 family protein, partial [Planctomycetota bacterium]